MKYFLKKIISLSFISLCMFACNIMEEPDAINRKQQEEFDKQFESQWSIHDRNRANTAINEIYLSQVEKEIYYYLNLARINPPLFGRTYAKAFNGVAGQSKGYAFDERKKTLLQELEQLDSLPLLKPNEILFESAECFATEGGKQGHIGHDRSSTGCTQLWDAECIHYAECSTGLEVVMYLLIDVGKNNSELGHRRICLSGRYNYLGVAVRYHKKYKKNAVLDFTVKNLE